MGERVTGTFLPDRSTPRGSHPAPTRHPLPAAARQARGRRLLATGLSLLTALAALALAAPLFGDPLHIDRDGVSALGLPRGPGEHGHLLGTDVLGRDLLARVVHALRTTLQFAVLANLGSVGLGTLVGLTAGFCRGALEQLLMRTADIFLSVPTVISALALAGVIGRGTGGIVALVTALYWAWTARLVHGETQRLRAEPFVEAALAHGVRPRTVLARHILPHIRTLLLSIAALNGAAVVVIGSGLSYLGAGVAPPQPELGSLLNTGAQALEFAPWLLLAPLTVVVALVLSFVLVGEGVSRMAAEPERRSWLDI
ncbi:ABC transporter permease [Streptomyces formicae]|uniref:ABC transporter permease n=1 Tax=Streptomyces formicae TaxID=1616117 RepID=A0ABY3WP32_9ACTN|nr:ABC transporter permease [Streptomyces formicae]UNM13224.1 ABC transporter permease [Streptomyces formicae]